MTTHEPTPAEVRQLAGRLATLADQVDALHDRMRQADEQVRRTRFRLDDVAGQLRGAAGEVEATAGDLARVRTARDDGLCGIGWSVCPEHGNTLTSTRGRSRCRTCGREWSYDRLGQPCTEPVTHELTDADGATRQVCDGHAIAARDQLTGSCVVPLSKPR